MHTFSWSILAVLHYIISQNFWNLVPDTVEAYESGELAKLLGISTAESDLWTKNIKLNYGCGHLICCAHNACKLSYDKFQQ